MYPVPSQLLSELLNSSPRLRRKTDLVATASPFAAAALSFHDAGAG
jgi:hypothetical protein